MTYLSCQVLENGGRVDGSGGSNSAVARRAVLQVPMDTTDGELRERERFSCTKQNRAPKLSGNSSGTAASPNISSPTWPITYLKSCTGGARDGLRLGLS